MSHLKRKELKWHRHPDVDRSIRSEATKIPNQENFSDTYVLKWDDALDYLVNSSIRDDGNDVNIAANLILSTGHNLKLVSGTLSLDNDVTIIDSDEIKLLKSTLTDDHLTYYDSTTKQLKDAPLSTDGTDLDLLGDLKTDRWISSDFNTLLGVGVAGLGNLSHGSGDEGWKNVFLGYETGYKNTTGYRNFFGGFQSGYQNLAGYSNIFLGYQSGFNNTSGYDNVFQGYRSGYKNIGGYANFFLGGSAGYENTEGFRNIFIGISAGNKNTTADFNTNIGAFSGYYNQTGNGNVNLGYQAAFGVSTKSHTYNVTVGYRSGFILEEGSYNTLLGGLSGDNITTADRCIIIGYGINSIDGTTDDYLNIGDAILGNLSTGDIDITGDLTAKGCKFGDGGTTDYVEVEADGTIVFNGAATVWDDLRVPISAIKRLGFTDPDWVQFKDDGAGSAGVYALAFASGLDEEIYFSCQLPHSYKEETDITPHVHWAPSDADAGNVTWKLEYTWQNANGTFGNTSTVSVTDSTDSTSHKHLKGIMSSITGTSKAISSMLICRLYRDVSDGDTYGSDAFLLEIDFHFEIDTIGSRLVLSK